LHLALILAPRHTSQVYSFSDGIVSIQVLHTSCGEGVRVIYINHKGDNEWRGIDSSPGKRIEVEPHGAGEQEGRLRHHRHPGPKVVQPQFRNVDTIDYHASPTQFVRNTRKAKQLTERIESLMLYHKERVEVFILELETSWVFGVKLFSRLL